MFGYEISFDRTPYLLALVALLPAIWLIGRQSLSGLGPVRRYGALALRCLLAVLLVLALAEIQFVRRDDRLSVVYLVDRSLSIAPERLDSVIEFVNQSSARQRQSSRGDVAGVITFGAEAAVEVPPDDADLALPPAFETAIGQDQTDLAGALRLARAVLPAGGGKRIVVLSDGNETLGDALTEARALAAEGIGIDVVPLARRAAGDVAIEKLVGPAEAREGAPFDLRVVLTNSGATADQPVAGRLIVRRVVAGVGQTIAEQPIEVRPGTQVFTLREELTATGFVTYEARFVPDDPQVDSVSQNNGATSFTHVRGEGRVLLIVEAGREDEFVPLAELLRGEQLNVTVQATNQLFATLAELQSYDVVVMADVPRTAGDDATSLMAFSDNQVQMLSENTGRLGCGLVMIGGPSSFGVGGWTGTPLEAAMPVDFQVKNDKIVPSGALMLVIDKSGSMSGEKIAMCRAAATEAVKMLGDRDYIGVVAFDSGAMPIVPLSKLTNRQTIMRRISRLDASGGTNMQPAMQDGYRALRGAEASIKHMIVLTDGQTAGAGYEQLAATMRREGMTVSAVAVGSGADSKMLAGFAAQGGGKFYHVTSPNAIPRIFMREARRVARPLVFEDERGFAPQLTFPHEILRGISGQWPAMTGFVLTTPKENPLVELSLVSPVPSGQTNPVLATWQYGLGRSAVWTTDFGQRWTKDWTAWEGRERIFTQLVRWAMRPRGGEGEFLVTTDVRDKHVDLVLTALDHEDQFQNFLAPQISVVGPDMQPLEAMLAQEALGRYVGGFDAPGPGAYFVVIAPRAGAAPLRIGVNVGYSEEFRTRDENQVLLEQLAALVPAGGAAGHVIELPAEWLDDAEPLPVDLFRHDLARATHRRPAWHLVLLCACGLFLTDVFNRRVAWNTLPVAATAARLRERWLRHRGEAPAPVALERLRSRKAELHEQWQGAYFAPTPDPAANDVTEVIASAAPAQPRAPRPTLSPAAPSAAPESAEEPDGYMNRLLKAKKDATPRRPNE